MVTSKVSGATALMGLLLAATAYGQPPADAIRQAEQARLEAARTQGRSGDFWAADALRIIPEGTVQPPPAPATPNPAAYVKELQVIAATSTAGVVTTLQGPRPATAKVRSATDPDRILRVWARQGDAWKIVASQGVWVRPVEPDTAPRVKAPMPAPYQPKDATERELLAVHTALNEAFAKHDVAAYERHTIPEFVRIGPFGQFSPRATFVKNALVDNKDARVPSVAAEVRIRTFGDVAVMAYRDIGLDAKGTTSARESRMMRVYVRRDGAWKAAAAINTFVWPQGTK